MVNKKLNKVVDINVKLKSRRVINDVLNALNKRKKITYAELENIGDELLSKDAPNNVAPLIIKNFLEINNEEVLMRYLYLIEFLNFKEFVPPLVYTILKRNVGDNFKANVINTLYNFEVDVNSPIFSKIFQDTENNFYRFDEKFFDEIQKNEDALVNALEWFFTLSYQKKVAILKRLNTIEDNRKIEFIEVVAHSDESQVALLAIDVLGAVSATEAIAALKRIAKEYEQGERGKRATRSLMKLKLRGVDCDEVVISSNEKELHACYASMIDSNGNYVLWAAFNKEQNSSLEVLCLLISETEGIVDCFGGSQMSKNEFKNIIKKAREEDYFVKIDYELCKKLMNDAVYHNNNSENSLPIEFLYRKKIFNGELFPEECSYQFTGYDLKKIKEDRILLQRGTELNSVFGVNTWVLLNSEIFTYAEKFLKITEKATPAIAEIKIEKLIEEIFLKLMLPDIDLMRKRLLFTAKILQFDKNNKKYVNMALCVALHLYNLNELPFKNPFIVNLILMSLKNAVKTKASVNNKGE